MISILTLLTIFLILYLFYILFVLIFRYFNVYFIPIQGKNFYMGDIHSNNAINSILMFKGKIEKEKIFKLFRERWAIYRPFKCGIKDYKKNFFSFLKYHLIGKKKKFLK
jgi:hypothetical protein